MAQLAISKVVVDEQDIYNELARRLAEKGTWKDLLPTNVSATLLTLASGATTVNQHYINVSLREAFLSTAVRDSSIFEGARSLGVKIARKVSAGLTCYLQNNLQSVKFIPAYSEFMNSSEKYFNREQLMIAPGTAIEDIQLYQGEVKTVEFDVDTLDPAALQTFVLSTPNFVVADMDMLVWTEDKVSGEATVWNSTDQALYELGPTDKAYYEFTTGSGDVAFMFGTGDYGSKLSAGTLLKIRFVVTKGSTAIGISGDRIRMTSQPEISGFTTSNVAGGGDQKSALYYKLFAPVMFRSNRKAISPSEVRAHIMAYPGVADCSLFFQRDVAPNDPKWQNVLRVCILPDSTDTWGGANPNPKSAAWTAFEQWLLNRCQALAQMQSWNPVKMYVGVKVLLAVNKDVDIDEMRILVTERILKLFQRKPGILGRRLSKSDIENACRLQGVDYIEILSPSEEIIPPDRTMYCVLDGSPVVNIVYTERTAGISGAN
jgi:hypothetical protein